MDGLLHRRFRVAQHAVKASDDRQRQNHIAILVRLVDTRQLIGNGPDQIRLFLDIYG